MSNLQIWNFSKGPNNEFEIAMVNKPSVFKPLKFYCSFKQLGLKDIAKAILTNDASAGLREKTNSLFKLASLSVAVTK